MPPLPPLPPLPLRPNIVGPKRKKARNNKYPKFAPPARFFLCICEAGIFSNSPPTLAAIIPNPVNTPALICPFLKNGIIPARIIFPASTSGKSPSRPCPTSMRTLRSCVAMSSNTPSSLSFEPSFHLSTILIEKPSIVSS